MRATALEFPCIDTGGPQPVWTGEAFQIGATERRILAYGSQPSGWTDDLTSLHEATAGEDHFIDLASRAYAVSEAIRTCGHRGAAVLEIGVSSGFLMRDLVTALPDAVLIGSDYTLGTLEAAAARLPASIPLLQFDLVQCPLPDASVDGVILLNVLEHIEDDRAAVAQLHRILRPGGVAILEVPAGAGLYDNYDRALMHWRRYQMSGFAALVRGAGFAIERRSHLGFLLYPGFFAAKKIGQRRPAPPQALNASVETSIGWTRRLRALAGPLMRFEAGLRRVAYLPFGIRCLITARKAA